MAAIVQLKYPDNVSILPGAVQNWHDLWDPAAASQLCAELLGSLEGVRSALIVGPHHAAFVARIVAAVETATFVHSSIVDCAYLGEQHPRLRVLCGDPQVALAQAGTFDLVVALDDVTRTDSLESPAPSWGALASALASAVAPGGRLLLAVENELGLPRLDAAENPFTRDRDADWAPLRTWDASRPRSRAQVQAWLAGTGLAGTVTSLFGPFRAPTLAVRGEAEESLGRLASAGVTRPVFQARALGLAGQLDAHATGWLVDTAWDADRAAQLLAQAAQPADPKPVAAPIPELPVEDLDGPRPTKPVPPAPVAVPIARWHAQGERLSREGADTTLTAPSASLMTALVEACTDNDLPRVRALLTAWREWLHGQARDGVLSADVADPRFDNVVLGDPWVTLVPAAGSAPLFETAWAALGDAYAALRRYGVRVPWPATMHPQSILEAMGAAAGLDVPADVARYLVPLKPEEAVTRQELTASVRKLQVENNHAWQRFYWNEKQYLTDRAIRTGKKVAQKSITDGKKAAQKGVADAKKVAKKVLRRG